MKKERIAWVDLIRVSAVLCVIMLHTFDHANLKLMPTMTSLEFEFYQIIRMIGRVAVPLFLMISGHLIINKAATEEPLRFYKKRVPQFILIIIAYTVINNYLISIAIHKELNISLVLSNLLNGNTGLAYPLWYMFVITGIYLFAPFIGRMVKACSDRDLKVYLSLAVILCFIPSTLNTLFHVNSPFGMIANSYGSEYVIYFITGYYLAKSKDVEAISTRTLIASFVFITILVVMLQFHLWRQDKQSYAEGITWYNSIFIYIQSCVIFAIAMKCDKRIGKSARKILSSLGKGSFFTYLIHLSFLDLILFSGVIHSSYKYLNLSVMIVMTYTICMVVFFALSRFRLMSILIK